MLAPVGTPIFAVADGVIDSPVRGFYNSTGAFSVDHGKFLARYCEVGMTATRALGLKPGTEVKQGQLIGFVGIMRSSSMLHFEMYSKDATGPLTVREPKTKTATYGANFSRRRDLIDPSPMLKMWMKNIPAVSANVEAMKAGCGTSQPPRRATSGSRRKIASREAQQRCNAA